MFIEPREGFGVTNGTLQLQRENDLIKNHPL
jgi:hypothetical protein